MQMPQPQSNPGLQDQNAFNPLMYAMKLSRSPHAHKELQAFCINAHAGDCATITNAFQHIVKDVWLIDAAPKSLDKDADASWWVRLDLGLDLGLGICAPDAERGGVFRFDRLGLIVLVDASWKLNSELVLRVHPAPYPPWGNSPDAPRWHGNIARLRRMRRGGLCLLPVCHGAD